MCVMYVANRDRNVRVYWLCVILFSLLLFYWLMSLKSLKLMEALRIDFDVVKGLAADWHMYQKL